MSSLRLVVDASVVVKWVLNEPDRPAALELLRQYQDLRVSLLAPHLLLYETGSVLWKHARRGTLRHAQATEAFDHLLRNAPELIDSPAIATSGVHLALAHRATVYDCLYLALALDQQCDLVTADRKFFLAVRRAYPSVRLLSQRA